MMFTFRRAFGRLVPLLALGVVAACSAGKPTGGGITGPDAGGTGNAGAGGAGATGGSVGASGGTIDPGAGGSISPAGGSAGSGMSGSAGQNFMECVTSQEMGMPVPVDVYVMLDISGSMLDPAGAAGSTMTKWDAVKSALSSFFADPQSAGLNVAIQYFPLRIPGVPTSCATDAECMGGAPCLLNICKLNPSGVLITCSTPGDTADCTNVVQRDDGPCEAGTAGMTCHLSGKACTTAADCQTIATVNNGDTALGACVDYGVCEKDNSFSCGDTSTSTNPKGCGTTLGACVPATTHFCAHETQCNPDSYATPAVEFLPLPDTAMTLNTSINAQMPLGDTPTRSSLRGAIRHARDWAGSHVGHTVLVVLVTDGLPTECTGGREISGESALALDDSVAVAQEGFAPATTATGTPASIETLVIGVFAMDETGSAQSNLDKIAKAGGSGAALVLNSADNVQQKFLDELNMIRSARLGCEFQIPPPKSGSQIDFTQVNVFLSQKDASAMGGNGGMAGNGGMTTNTELYYVTPDGCTGAADEWHYDKPLGMAQATGLPTKIVACPATCEALHKTQNATINIGLGCVLHQR